MTTRIAKAMPGLAGHRSGDRRWTPRRECWPSRIRGCRRPPTGCPVARVEVLMGQSVTRPASATWSCPPRRRCPPVADLVRRGPVHRWWTAWTANQPGAAGSR